MSTMSAGTRAIMPFLQRAEEVERADPLVAYYTRLYALEQGIAKGADDDIVEKIFVKLESQKQSLGLNPENDQMHIEGFAMSIFTRADKADRSSNSNAANTAKAFSAANRFLKVCTQFGPLPSNLKDKFTYSAWRATQIQHALREGRAPEPPPQPVDWNPAEEEEEGAAAAAAADGGGGHAEAHDPSARDDHGAGSGGGGGGGGGEGNNADRSHASESHAAATAASFSYPPPQPSASTQPSSHLPDPHPPSTSTDIGIGSTAAPPALDSATILSAQKQARIAVSALGFDDIPSAVAALEKALAMLKR